MNSLDSASSAGVSSSPGMMSQNLTSSFSAIGDSSDTDCERFRLHQYQCLFLARLVAIWYSQVDMEQSPLKLQRLFLARKKVSWATSSASWRLSSSPLALLYIFSQFD